MAWKNTVDAKRNLYIDTDCRTYAWNAFESDDKKYRWIERRVWPGLAMLFYSSTRSNSRTATSFRQRNSLLCVIHKCIKYDGFPYFRSIISFVKVWSPSNRLSRFIGRVRLMTAHPEERSLLYVHVDCIIYFYKIKVPM